MRTGGSVPSVLACLLIAMIARGASAGEPRDDYSWIRGANYVPSYARNDVQIWMDYDAEVIDRELGYDAK